jgi:hypothetical protein
VVLGAAAVAMAVIGIQLHDTLEDPLPPPQISIVAPAQPAQPARVAVPATPAEPAPELESMTLSIDVEPDDAMLSVFVDDAPVTTGTGDERVVVRGTADTKIEVLAHAAGHEPFRGRIAFDPDGRRMQVALSPSPEPPATKAKAPRPGPAGVIRMGTTAGTRPARVLVDGSSVGMTPIASYEASPGRHEVQWRWPDGTTETRTVTVVADEAITLEAG